MVVHDVELAIKGHGEGDGSCDLRLVRDSRRGHTRRLAKLDVTARRGRPQYVTEDNLGAVPNKLAAVALPIGSS
jgi:hypothetical protein